jgi:serine/threonine protein kinase
VSDSTNGTCLSAEAAIEYAQAAPPSAKRDVIHAHVMACPTCLNLVAAAYRGLGTGSWSPESNAAATTRFRDGMQLANRFEIQRFVAKGAMGEVYEVYDRELETMVALKTVATIASNSSRAEQYLRKEVTSARRIAHENVCRIYEWGTHFVPDSSSKIHFFTMEFVHGPRLGTVLRKQGPLSLMEAFMVARQLLSGLAAAHAAGIVHRDFKSDNVILSEKDGLPRAVILDFGLAQPLHLERGSASVRLEGTRLYMAPEQHEGKPLTAAADIYAFGVVLFEMLTGRRPFERDDGSELPLACLTEEPLEPRRVNPLVSRQLQSFVLRCLRRDPRARYSSAAEALQAFEACSTGTSSQRPRRTGPSIGTVAALTVPVVLLLTILLRRGDDLDPIDGEARVEPRRELRPPTAPPRAPLVSPEKEARTHVPDPPRIPKMSPSTEAKGRARNLVPLEERRTSTRTASVPTTTSPAPKETSIIGSWESFEGPSEMGPRSESSTPTAEATR